ncbi:MAG TPA: Ig-like domain-containing protein, partial [Gemmatimonadales bacterium]|nr:Ig-like domain-containing protein [Gemmatimonadales bacterium]
MKRVAVTVLLVAACDPSFTFPAPIVSVRVTPDSIALVAGDSVQLSAQAADPSGHPIQNVRFVWTSSTDSVATVSASGLVRTLRPGSVSITASADTVKGSAGVRIAARIVSVGIDQGPILTVLGGSVPFTAFGLDPQGDTLRNRAIVWTSSDTAVFTVSSGGVVLGRSPGFAKLTAGFDTIRSTVSVGILPAVFQAISAGEADHTCGLTTGNLAFCWGANDLGQLGVPSLLLSAVPVASPTFLSFSGIHAGGTFTCGDIPADFPWCWGSNFRGRLGVGATPGSSVFPLPVSQAPPLQGLTTGWNDTCGLHSGQVYCWGENPGAGGAGAVTLTPELLTADSALVVLDASVGFVCGLTAGGTPLCWGVNALGQLGNGMQTPSTSPVPLAGGYQFVGLGGGSGHACGLTAAGAAYCWGLNASGQLGTGDTVSSLVPVPVATALVFKALDAGGTQTCALAANSSAYCWGNGVTSPAPVSGGLHFRTLTVGDRHVCGLAADGRAY